MKLDSADLTLASGQVITVLDLTILCEKSAQAAALASSQNSDAAQAAVHDIRKWEATPCGCPPESRLTVQGRTAAELHVGEEIYLEDVAAGLSSDGDVLRAARVFVQSIEPLHDSPVRFNNFLAAS